MIPRRVLGALAELRVADEITAADQTRDFRAALLGTPQGVRVLAWIIDSAGVLKTTMQRDGVTAAYAEGRRSLAVEIMEIIEREIEG